MTPPHIRDAVISLLMAGKTPSWRAVRSIVGAGSADTLLANIKDVLKDLAHQQMEGVPESVSQLMWQLWKTACSESADNWALERVELQDTLQAANQAHAEAVARAQDLAAEKTELTAQVRTLEAEVAALRSKVEHQDNRLEERDQAIARQRDEIDTLHGDIRRLHEAHQVQAREQEERQHRLLAEQAVEHTTTMRKLEEQLQLEKGRYETDTARWIKKLDEQTIQARRDAQEQGAALSALQAANQAQLQRVNDLLTENVRLQGSLEQQSQTVAAAKDLAHRLDRLLAEEKERCIGAERRAADAEGHLAAAREEIDRLRSTNEKRPSS
ncbi:DNA-binding protein [Pseudomonas aeruginosa]|uniref:DNA-binding protein n=3 Tax=Pseudomonas aeruginosa TaxID=287 RepID=UPI0005B3264C|nr:DNA-binding protein [Pseudomonas aeruginosa]EKU5976099.1 DNA-binding protein [Pseudomonas aeruginosa]ELL1256568.1 DNA-binding protein [Pseudomonas aeruginosa]ELM1689157.1 DNA-binding protein [Pseudomonas aeruginosa]MBG6687123.1 DNA-binding protein [Pseudomonas aeruginosa]MBG6723026.1 DNA-binding protein [Pseudomonas aeruginosa]